MSRITFDKFREGQTADATNLNQPYDDLATLSIDKDNTKPNWATRVHFDGTGEKANEVFFYEDATTAGWNTNQTTYQNIGLTTNAVINFSNAPVQEGDLLRAGASGIIGNVTCNTDGDGDGTQDSYNYFSFRLLVTYNTGGANQTATLAEAGYSFTRRSRLTNDSTGLDQALWWRNFSFSGIFRMPANGTLISVALQGKVGPNGGAGNQLDVTRHNINAVIVRN